MTVLVLACLLLPALGALAAAVVPRPLALVTGLGTAGVALLASVGVALAFHGGAGMQGQTDVGWIPGLDVRFHVGVDGISLPLLLLTTGLFVLSFGYLLGRPTDRPRSLAVTLLVLEVGVVGTFLALDLVLFFVFFEVVLVPMYLVIAGWGGGGRRAAALQFLLYTVLGSAVMLVGLLGIGLTAGTFDMVRLAASGGAGISHGVQVACFLAVLVGFAVKTPAWPLHTWLPDAHTEAPTVGSVLLAGVLLKMGTYGLVRVGLPVLPEGARFWAPLIGLVAVVGIVHGSLCCLAQPDLKRLIAYSSIGHMGFVLLGIATLTPLGVNAALIGNIAHGVITGLLFFVVGGLKDRYGTDRMSAMGGGLYGLAPRYGALLAFAAVASLGLPGLAGFWGEMLALQAAFEPHAGLSRSYFLVLMTVAGLGLVLTALYFLGVIRRVAQGVPPPSRIGQVAEVRIGEWLAWSPLVVAALAIGLWPRLVLGLTDPVVTRLFGGG